MSKGLPSNLVRPPPPVTRCFVCDSTSHVARDCPAVRDLIDAGEGLADHVIQEGQANALHEMTPEQFVRRVQELEGDNAALRLRIIDLERMLAARALAASAITTTIEDEETDG